MQLQLLDMDQFIQVNNVQEVTSLNTPSKTKKYSEPTLWSSIIFGEPGSKDRSRKFGYISLNTKVISPSAYRIVKGLNMHISAAMDGRKSYQIKDGVLIEDKANGSTGVSFIIDHFDELDFNKLAKPEKKQEAKFINDHKTLILIDKIIVIPAQSRDLDINSKAASVSDLNNIYLDILRNSQSMIAVQHEVGEIRDVIVKQLQHYTLSAYNWLSRRLTGKKGLFRSTMLKKTTDYSSRLVLASSPNIKFGKIGVPWHTLIQLYAPLFYHTMRNQYQSFENDIIEFMKIENSNKIGYNTFLKFAKTVNKAPSVVPKIMIMKIKEILNVFLENETIVYKRDPVLSRKSWASATPVIIDGAIAQLNSLDLGPLGGDSDGDTILLAPLFAEESKKAAEKLNPAKNKSKWIDEADSNQIVYGLSLDTVSAIFNVTKE